MEYIPIERSDDAFQQPVEQSHLIVLCQRAFGEDIQIERAKELGGGLYNTTYLVPSLGCNQSFACKSSSTCQFRLEKNLMRNEYMSLPFLAPLLFFFQKSLWSIYSSDP